MMSVCRAAPPCRGVQRLCKIFVVTWQGGCAGLWTGLGDSTATGCPAVQACSTYGMLARKARCLEQASRLAADLTNMVGESAAAHMGRLRSPRSGQQLWVKTRVQPLLTAHSHLTARTLSWQSALCCLSAAMCSFSASICKPRPALWRSATSSVACDITCQSTGRSTGRSRKTPAT